MKETVIPIRLYRPSNGSEGEGFHGNWCEKCARDLSANGTKEFDYCVDLDVCAIIGKTFMHRIDEPEYPSEWRYVDGIPTCTAFVPIGNPIPTGPDLEAAGQMRLIA